MISNSRSAALPAALLAIVLLLAGCGSDSDDGDDATPDSTTTTAVDTTTTASAATTTTASGTTTAPTPTGEALVQGSITSDADVTATWELTGAADQLCFEATLTHPDAATADTLGDGVSECIDPSDGTAPMDDALSVSVGVVDGERTFGYLWGRADATIVALAVTHTDGSQTTVELADGPSGQDGVQVFAVILDTTKIAAVDTLDASSASGLEDSEPIRDFLRAGPTYPTTPPVTTPEADLYPTAGG